MMNGPTVVCVLRSGGEYKPEHVFTLLNGVQMYWPSDWPLRMVVLTDVRVQPWDPGMVEEIPLKYRWKGWWSKMELFRPDLDYLGDILFFDLDTVIVGDLTDVSGVERLTLLNDFYRNAQAASGLMYLPTERRAEMWAAWDEGRANTHGHRGDQEFMRAIWNEEQRWQTVLPGQVVSFKVHVRGTGVPEGARVVCFHGKPRPWQVGW